MIVGSRRDRACAFGKFVAGNRVSGTTRRGKSGVFRGGITMPGGDIDRRGFSEVCTS